MVPRRAGRPVHLLHLHVEVGHRVVERVGGEADAVVRPPPVQGRVGGQGVGVEEVVIFVHRFGAPGNVQRGG